MVRAGALDEYSDSRGSGRSSSSRSGGNRGRGSSGGAAVGRGAAVGDGSNWSDSSRHDIHGMGPVHPPFYKLLYILIHLSFTKSLNKYNIPNF